VRCSRIEDLELARRVKQARLRMLLMIATQSLRVAMYASLGDACEGFRKNLYALLGNSDGDFFLISSVFASWIASVCLSLLVYPQSFLIYSFCGVCVMLAQNRLFATPLAVILRMPLVFPIVSKVLISSRQGTAHGTLQWKDRVLPENCSH
jgi:hypothetical protein